MNNQFPRDRVGASPKELAAALHNSLQKDMKELTNNQSLKEILEIIKNPETFNREIYFLKIFATDIGIMMSEHEESLKTIVRKAFLTEVSESNFYLEQRFDTYATALNTTHHLKAPYTVIRQFMQFCDLASSIMMYDIACEFTGDLIKISEFMKSIRITIGAK